MRKRCWNCKKWEEHFYWDHLEDSSFHFLKIMDGDFSERMEFPMKFAKNFRFNLFDVVALKGPTGRSWEIGLSKEQDHLYFKHGWEQFVEENQIEQGQTLMFEYAGDSSFTVQTFDQNGLVRAAVLHEPSSDNRSTSSIRICEDQKVGIKELVDLDSDLISERKAVHVRSQDIAKTLQIKFAGKEGDCFFVKLITRSNLRSYPYLNIPMEFLSKHIPRKPNGITICDQSKKKWFVSCTSNGNCWGFYGKTLQNFLIENSCREGDACVFELKEKGKEVVMEVRIVLAKEVESILKNSSC